MGDRSVAPTSGGLDEARSYAGCLRRRPSIARLNDRGRPKRGAPGFGNRGPSLPLGTTGALAKRRCGAPPSRRQDIRTPRIDVLRYRARRSDGGWSRWARQSAQADLAFFAPGLGLWRAPSVRLPRLRLAAGGENGPPGRRRSRIEQSALRSAIKPLQRRSAPHQRNLRAIGLTSSAVTRRSSRRNGGSGTRSHSYRCQSRGRSHSRCGCHGPL